MNNSVMFLPVFSVYTKLATATITHSATAFQKYQLVTRLSKKLGSLMGSIIGPAVPGVSTLAAALLWRVLA